MKSKETIIAAALALSLVGCAQLTTATNTVCGDMAKLPVTVTAVLDAQDPHSALGVLWIDAKAGCVVGAPAVSPDWHATVWAGVKKLAPIVIPWLIGML